MLDDIEDFRTTWNAQPTTFFRLTPAEMRSRLERVDKRQRRIARGILVALIGDVISFTAILLWLDTNALEAVGLLWIVTALAWFTLRLRKNLRDGEHAYGEMVSRPSIDGFRASLAVRWGFYRSLLWFGAVLPGLALFLTGALIAHPNSVSSVVATAALMVVGIANGFRVHLPKARAIRDQLAELDQL